MVSVVIPVYNSQAYIAACIESVLQQTFDAWELILVDDGSQDDSGRICDGYVCRDSRVQVIHQPNGGRTSARARGVMAAKGEWVAFVDSDDQLPQDALERLYAATSDDTDIVLGNGQSLGLTPCPKTITMDAFRHLAVRGEGTIGVPWGSLYRKSLLTANVASQQDNSTSWVFDIPRHIVNGEDYLFWLRLVFLTDKPVHIVEESVYDKGDEHTSNSFVWTADYCYELNELRKQSIPVVLHKEYLSDMVSDRLVNMFSVATWTPKKEWAHSRYYEELNDDMKAVNRRMSLKERLFLALPSLRVRRLCSSLNIGEALRFGVVGVAATALHYLLYYLLLSVVSPTLAFTIGYAISFACNYVLSSRYTFRVSMSVQRFSSFVLSHLVNYFVGLALLHLFLWTGLPPALAPLPAFVIAVPINFLLVRFALKRVQHENDGYMIFLLLTGFGILLLNLLDAPTLSDDMIYHFMWNDDADAEVKTIGGIADLLQSQWTHYFAVNGRLPVHLLAQAFFAFVPSIVLQIINSVLFVLMIHLCTLFLGNKNRLFVAMMVVFLLFVVMNGFRTTMVWSLGAFNYLWVLVAVLTLIVKTKALGLLALFALFAGWSHEALSLPLSVAIVCYLFINRKSLRRDVLPYLVLFLLGTALCFLSPGIISRSTDGITLMNRMISAVLNCVSNIRVLWLLLIVLLVLWKRDKLFLRQHLQENVYAYIALTASFGITLLCGTSLERVAFFTDFIAMLLLLKVLCVKMSALWQRRLMVAACALMLVCYVPAYVVRQENYSMWQDMERQMKEPGRELIAVQLPDKGRNALMDYFRNHYVNPSAEFGFYSIYMAFDASDINMRCAAKMYGKPHLTFLPADIVSRIEGDSTAYSSYETDKNNSLYVWRLPENKCASSVRFILNEEDVSALHFWQRPLVYDGDVYELDDFHFKTVQVCGHPYLVFTRPTTNITRRIKDIELDF